MAEAVAFYLFAACILGFGVLVVTSQNPVHSVIFLVLDFLSVAGLYVVLGAQFVAAIQVLVYAGGIVVLYLFVVMLVNLQRQPATAPGRRPQARAGFALAAVMLAELSAILVFSASHPASVAAAAPPAPSGMGNTTMVGLLLYSDYLVPFEVASMLLLVAMVGAIILARKDA